MDNPDHYKYMHHAPGDEREEPRETPLMETQEEPLDSIEEQVTIMVQETVVPAAQEAVATPSAKADTLQIDETWEMLGKGILRFFYDFLNPFLMPTYATLLIFELSILRETAPGASILYTLTVLGISCLIPLVAIFVLRRISAIDSISLERRNERALPYIISFLAMVGLSIFFMVKGAPAWIYFVYWGASATILVNFLINLRWRVSNHCSAIAAMLATLMAINQDGIVHPELGWWAIGTVIIAGIIGTGAIILGNHKLKDVLIGYATGFLPIVLFHI